MFRLISVLCDDVSVAVGLPLWLPLFGRVPNGFMACNGLMLTRFEVDIVRLLNGISAFAAIATGVSARGSAVFLSSASPASVDDLLFLLGILRIGCIRADSLCFLRWCWCDLAQSVAVNIEPPSIVNTLVESLFPSAIASALLSDWYVGSLWFMS